MEKEEDLSHGVLNSASLAEEFESKLPQLGLDKATSHGPPTGQPNALMFNPLEAYMSEAYSDQESVDATEADAGDSQLYTATNLKNMKLAHNRMKLSENQAKTAKDYMQQVMYSVPLNQLYKLMASCNYNENADFCPVLVRIMDPIIRKYCQQKQYLLQVWAKGGTMLFERALKKPVSNWNLTQDIFLFQEETNSPEVYLVRLYKDEQPFLFKFNLPERVTAGLVNTTFKNGKFQVPPEALQGTVENDVSAIQRSEENDLFSSVAQNNAANTLAMSTESKPFGTNTSLRSMKVKPEPESIASPGHPSISQLFSSEIIERSPDRMIDYKRGVILLAYRDRIIHLNVEKHHVEDPLAFYSPADIINKRKTHQSFTLKEQDITTLSLQQDYKIIAIQEIGIDLSCVILEDTRNRQLRFLRIDESTVEGKTRIKLVQLGLMVNHSELEESPLLKYRSVVKVDPATGKIFNVGVALRENGRIEIYSDFMLVNEFYDPKIQVVDIETDFNNFYYKMVNNADKVNQNSDPKNIEFFIRQVRHIWRNRIGISTSRKKERASKWDHVVDMRVADYFRLYSQIISFSLFMIVAHRDMISVYDFRIEKDATEGKWTDTYSFGKDHIRSIFLKKRPKTSTYNQRDQVTDEEKEITVYRKYQIVCLIGTSVIKYTHLTPNGMLARHGKRLKQIGRILRFANDKWNKHGILLLADKGRPKNEYDRELGCKLYTFPLNPDRSNSRRDPDFKGNVVKLVALKAQEFYNLLDSTQNDLIASDLQFCAIKAMRHSFEVQKDNFVQQQDDEVKDAFPDSDYCSVISCSSRKMNTWQLLPIVIEREEETGLVSDIRVITNSANVRELEVLPESQGKNIQTFFMTQSNDSDMQQTLVCITENSINVYDKDLIPQVVVQGLRIRHAINRLDRYIYTSSDRVESPWSIKMLQSSDYSEYLQPNWQYTSEGFYIYDIHRLVEGGSVVRYKLASGIGGCCTVVESSKFSERMSLIASYNTVAVVPFPHLNKINCVGMSYKQDYLIWREKNGFFTALDKRGNLLTWSLINGKLQYSEPQEYDAREKEMAGYEVYRADDQDITYTRDFYRFEDMSVSLLKSKKPVLSESLSKQQTSEMPNQSYVMHKLNKQITKNEQGLDSLNKLDIKLEENIFTSSSDNTTVEIYNTSQESNLYRFKVMQLKTHEDTKVESECKLRFHFLFPLIKAREKLDEAEDMSYFDWDIMSSPVQRLFLSRDTQRMMEVKNNFVATVYTRYNIDETGKSINFGNRKFGNFDGLNEPQDDGQQVKWKVEFRIKRYPKQLAQLTSVPFMFSPNFTYQFDFNYKDKVFQVRTTKDQEIYLKVPFDLIDTTWKNTTGLLTIKMICSRIRWESDTVLRIVNQSNLDCLFEMQSTGAKGVPLSKNQRWLKLISASKIDNLTYNQGSIDSPHLLSHPLTLEPEDIKERLIRMNQNYKTTMEHAINTGDQKFDLLQQLTKIDYLQNWGDFKSSFDIEQSFTWIDWLIMEQGIYDPNYELESENSERKIQLCFNIFPQGKGVLHQFADTQKLKAQGRTTMDEAKAYFPTRDFFETAIDEEYELPILRDIYGQTPLHICLGLQSLRAQDKVVFEQKAQKANKLQKTENFIMADLILDNIKDYGMLHSSHQITDALIEATRAGLPSVKSYMESRMLKAQHPLLETSQRYIRNKHTRTAVSMGGKYGFLLTKVFGPVKDITDELFKKYSPSQPMNLQQLDLPHIYKRTPEGIEFIRALSKCNDLQYFSLKSVQIIIDNHAEFWNRVSFIYIGGPMLLQLVSFWYWSNFILPNLEDAHDYHEQQDSACRFLLISTSIYLVGLETSVIVKDFVAYLKRPTALLNLLTPLLIAFNVFKDNRQDTSFWNVQSWAAVIIWFRFMLYLRFTRMFSWLMRMITECILDMATFVLVLLFGIIAFADAFQSIEQILILRGDIERVEIAEDATMYERHFQAYFVAVVNSFLTALGEFNGNIEFYQKSDWLIFVLCCLFNIVLLLNLLIAIISETYARISASSVETGYKEKALQMSVTHDTLLGYLGQQKADPCELVFTAQEISSDQMAVKETDLVVSRIEDLSDQMDEVRDSLNSALDERFYKLSVFLAEQAAGDEPDSDDSIVTASDIVDIPETDGDKRKQGVVDDKKAEEKSKSPKARPGFLPNIDPKPASINDQADIVMPAASPSLPTIKAEEQESDKDEDDIEEAKKSEKSVPQAEPSPRVVKMGKMKESKKFVAPAKQMQKKRAKMERINSILEEKGITASPQMAAFASSNKLQRQATIKVPSAPPIKAPPMPRAPPVPHSQPINMPTQAPMQQKNSGSAAIVPDRLALNNNMRKQMMMNSFKTKSAIHRDFTEQIQFQERKDISEVFQQKTRSKKKR